MLTGKIVIDVGVGKQAKIVAEPRRGAGRDECVRAGAVERAAGRRDGELNGVGRDVADEAGRERD